MKKFVTITLVALACACNNSKKEKETVTSDSTGTTNTSTTPTTNTETTSTGEGNVSYMVNDTARTAKGTVLVQEDKDKISPGNNLIAMLTASKSDGESLTVNFLFTPKPGTYPVVGLGLNIRNEVYGGILGGKPKMTPYKVNLTECTDLGSNGAGGHKWKIAGSVDQEMTIDAMSLMKMVPGHPDNAKVSKYQFSNITFDDNWEKLLEEGLKKMKEQQ
jgi:hypothetical protein